MITIRKMHCLKHPAILGAGLLLILLGFTSIEAKSDPLPEPPNNNVQFTVTTVDSTDKSPIPLVRISLTKEGIFISGKVTDPQGHAVFRDVRPGTYHINFHDVGYNDFSDSIVIDALHTSYSAALVNIKLGTVTVTANREGTISSIDVNTGQQVFESEDYHAPPSSRMTDLIQQNLAGAARAPTGEVHIRGQHGEFTYYVDGVPVPLGVFGGLNEIVDPKVINRATFMTGGFPAEYGGQMAAVIDVQNRVPTGAFHLDASEYTGSYLVFNGATPFSPGTNQPFPFTPSSSAPSDTLGGKVGPFRALNSNGQALSFSDHMGNFGYFVSGSRQETDRRIDQPNPTLYNDHGLDYFLYGKFEYLIGDNDYITANLNFGQTNTEVPFDTSAFAPDHQLTSNSFQTLSYYHTFSSESDRESHLFVGLLARQGGLTFTPSAVSPVNFQFAGDSTMYALNENRSFSSYGIRTLYDIRYSHEFQVKTGFTFTVTNGTEDFSSRDSAGNPGPHSITNFAGSDFGVFAQTEYHPVEWTSFEIGLRYDQHIAPDAPLENQVSPRIKWNFLIDEANSAYVYFGRMFMPTNTEGLRLITSNVANTSEPTLTERDDFWEAAYMHSFSFGLKSKLAAYYKLSTPGVDDETVGSSAIKTPVNIAFVHVTGIELALSYNHPTVPIIGYLNAAINHAYGSGAVAGGFLPIISDGNATDLDHDQRFSITAGINYQPNDWFVSLSTIYGSGLTNGNPHGAYTNSAGITSFPTGLFDFNDSAHVPASIIFNAGGGYIFHLAGGSYIEPSLFITNLFDNNYFLKGSYFSAAFYGERRNVVLNLAYHI